LLFALYSPMLRPPAHSQSAVSVRKTPQHLSCMQLARFGSLWTTHKHLAAKQRTMTTTAAGAKTALDEMDKGEFKRTAAGFRSGSAPAAGCSAARQAVAQDATHTCSCPTKQEPGRARRQVCTRGRPLPPVHLICLPLGLPHSGRNAHEGASHVWCWRGQQAHQWDAHCRTYRASSRILQQQLLTPACLPACLNITKHTGPAGRHRPVSHPPNLAAHPARQRG
jgi:hypothetical protein